MKPAGRAVFVLGVVLGGIVVIWGWVGFYASAVPVMLLLGGGGIALMAVGSKMHKDKEPNKAVQWQPGSIIESQHPASPSVEPVPWVLIGRNGVRYQLASSALVGRDPGAAGHAITVADADSSMSRVHALVTVLGDVVRIRDMGSANGTVVVTPEGVEIECEQHQDTVVPAGSTVELGNCAFALVASHSAEEL